MKSKRKDEVHTYIVERDGEQLLKALITIVGSKVHLTGLNFDYNDYANELAVSDFVIIKEVI